MGMRSVALRAGFLALLLAWAQALSAAPKTVAYLRVLEAAPIYHGASLSSAVEAKALKGDIYALASDKLNHGFYKIDYSGHVSYIEAAAVVLIGAQGSPVPTPRASPVSSPEGKATPTIETSPEDGDDGEDGAEPTPALRPTAEPTRLPTMMPTAGKTFGPLRPTPTVAATEKPTERPTLAPTERPTSMPTAKPGLTTPAVARGKLRVPPSQPRAPSPARAGSSSLGLSSAYRPISIGGNVGAGGSLLRREPGHMDRLELVLPLGLGKHQALVQPPYRQNASVDPRRPIESAGFFGLGLEYRVVRPLRIELDWIAHSHSTKAADLGSPALKVGVPGSPATTSFDASEAYYRMNTHQFRLGLKLSYPHPRVEPWADLTYGLWAWSAELSGPNREIGYGEDVGLAFGGTVGLGIDFHGSFGGSLGWTLGPFVEWGAPQLHPTLKDIAGLGVDWKDSFGTPAAIPARAGIQFGIGF